MVDRRYDRQRCSGSGGCSCNYGRSPMEKLRAVEFAIIDTALYLDVYPECKAALAHYHKLVREREELADVVNRTYGPLTIGDNCDENKWTWVKGPWPWEPDAN